MGKNLIIFGNNKLSLLMLEYIQKYTDYNVCAFCVDKAYLQGETYGGYPNIPFEEIENFYQKDDFDILICIGNNKMNDIRKAKYLDIKKKGYSIAQFIHPTVHLETDEIGEGNIILENVSLGMDAKLGNCNVLWNGCNFSHGVQIGDFNYIAPTIVAGNAKIGNNCFICVGSSIRSGISVADYSMIGAGCYLNNDTEPYDVYVPARSVKLNKKSIDMAIN